LLVLLLLLLLLLLLHYTAVLVLLHHCLTEYLSTWNPTPRSGADTNSCCCFCSFTTCCFLTVLVLLHHCLTEYLSTWKPWKARKGDTAHWLLVQLFVNGNQAYFMTLFFFLSGEACDSA
jgi:hypothetical protein